MLFNHIYRLQFRYGDQWGPVRGATIGTHQEYILPSSGFINTISTCYGKVLDGMVIYDQDDNILGHIGRTVHTRIKSHNLGLPLCHALPKGSLY